MYIWDNKKQKRVVHIINTTSNGTLCLMENGFWHPERMITGEQPPIKRRICKTCSQQFGKELKIVNRVTKKTGNNKNKFYSTPEWKRVRYQALVKYGNRCMCCGISREDGAVIQVDHVKPRHKYPELALDINNLQILCASCNRGKYGDDSEQDDWRTQAERHIREIIQEE